MPVYFSKVVTGSKGVYLPFLSLHVSGVSLWAYLMSTTVFCVVLIAPILGALSDYLALRKFFFSFFTVLGGTTTIGFYISYPGKIWFTAALVFISYLSFLLAEVFYNSFLPAIVPKDSQDLVSGIGYSWGYLGGALLLGLYLILLSLFNRKIVFSEYRILRVCLASAGLWWLLFALPALKLLPRDSLSSSAEKCELTFSMLCFPFGRIMKLRIAMLFLLAFFFYNNGIQTVITMASIYGSHYLRLQLSNILLALLVSQIVGFPGALVFAKASKQYGTKNMLIFSLIIWCLIVCYAYFINHSYEFFILAAIVGFVIGGSQALSRSFYSKIIPLDMSSQYFGFYAIGGKLSSLLGPFVFGLIFDITHNFRYAVVSTLAFFIVGLLFLVKVPYNQNKQTA